MFPKSMRSIGGLYLRKLSRRRLNPRTAIQRSRARFELPRMFCLDSLRTAIHCFVCQLFVALVVTIGGPGFAQNAGSPAASDVNDEAGAIPGGYSPRDGDVVLFTIPGSESTPANLMGYAGDGAQYYYQRALARLRASRKQPVSGNLTVSALLKPGDKPEAV